MKLGMNEVGNELLMEMLNEVRRWKEWMLKRMNLVI